MAGSRRIGVLALQGDVREHRRVLTDLGAEVSAVRRPSDLAGLDGLVLPGGESTVMDKLGRAFGLSGPLSAALADGLPAYGTCAGLILLARRLENPIDGQQTLGPLDVTVRRNAFGSQTASFETDLDAPAIGSPPVHAVFIRAPLVTEAGPDVDVLAEVPGGGIVAVRQGPLLGTAFHPEVTGDLRFHRYFLEEIVG